MKSKEMSLGFSTGVFFTRDIPLQRALREIYEVSPGLVELNLATLDEMEALTDEDLSVCERFDTVTIHAPFKGIRYTTDSEDVLKRLRVLAEQLKAQYVVFHPDIIDDFEVIEKQLSSLAAIENMDWRKKIGSSVDEMRVFFEQCPSARWLCDLNHAYTVDQSMQLATDLHQAFEHKLAGYHVSAFNGEVDPHSCFYLTGDARILNHVQQKNVPVINEGLADDEDFLTLEFAFMHAFFAKLTD